MVLVNGDAEKADEMALRKATEENGKYPFSRVDEL
jgi:hypothetical protein